MNDDELLRYSRQIMLPEVDIDGQEKLCDARVLIIGLGGLGCPVAMYLAAAGVGTLVLADYDHVDLSNLQRQIAHTSDRVGESKVASAAQTIAALNPPRPPSTHAAHKAQRMRRATASGRSCDGPEDQDAAPFDS